MKKISLIVSLFSIFHINAQTTADTFAYKEIMDIPYLEPDEIKVDTLQCLNLVLPETVEKPPLFLWIGGGAWSFVNRHVEMNLARKFARSGIAVAAVGHQLSSGKFSEKAHPSGIQHPEHIKDIAAAFKWLYDHAEEYGYDQDNLFVGGFSSGAHLAALLAMDDSYLSPHQLTTKQIKAILPIAGAYDIKSYYEVFLNHERENVRPMAETHVMDVFGQIEADFIAASPTTYIDNLVESNIPMLLVSEAGLYNYTKIFEEKLWESEYRNCQILHVFNLGHGGLWKDISNADDSQTRNVMIDFIKRNATLSGENDG